MKLKLLVILLILLGYLACPTGAMATVDPLEVANNKIGIHILDPGEIEAAARLVNNDGKGQWGYVTVPIQASDRDLIKWQRFMSKARELKMIPIVRVLTVPEGSNWVEPNNFDLIDFANFLNELEWPVRNRYVIIFNEVNHATEFGGYLSPERYALILLNSIKIFKARSSDFFILPSAMDNGTKTDSDSLNWKTYLLRMSRAQSDVLKMIDGWNSHAYPNPGMVGKVTDRSDHSVHSYEFDLNYLKSLGVNKDLPVFITETGWDSEKVGGLSAAVNLSQAFQSVWNAKEVVVVTPFLLRAGEGPFVKFSFLNQDGSPRGVYTEWQRLSTKGGPVLSDIKVPLPVGVAGIPLPVSVSTLETGALNWQNLWNGILGWFKVQ